MKMMKKEGLEGVLEVCGGRDGESGGVGVRWEGVVGGRFWGGGWWSWSGDGGGDGER